MVGDEERRKSVRTHRARIRAAIENSAENDGSAGVVTAWVCIAEVSSYEDGEPCKTLWIDHAYHDDTALVPWMFNGLVEHALDALNRPECMVCGDDGD